MSGGPAPGPSVGDEVNYVELEVNDSEDQVTFMEPDEIHLGVATEGWNDRPPSDSLLGR